MAWSILGRGLRKKTAVWGSAMFFVACVSLYFMIETATDNPGQSYGYAMPGFNTNEDARLSHNVDGIVAKMQLVERQLQQNQKVVGLIRDTVRQLIRSPDKASLKKLQQVLDSVDPPAEPRPVGVVPRAPNISYPAPAPISKDVCVVMPEARADVKVSSIYELLPFDNAPGGEWTQGFPISYSATRWQKRKLKVFVVPHSHNDPGWIKTFDKYYATQTRPILNMMVEKLEQYPKMRFIYAEMSFFHRFYEESSVAMQNRVKKLLRGGNLEIVSGGWVMPDEANTHYFALLDQLIEGNLWLLNATGVKPRISWAIDPFGLSSTMAYLLRRAGFTAMLIQRVHYAVKKHLAQTQQLEFLWRQSWDGSNTTDMLCHMMPFYVYDIPHTCGPQPKVCCQFDFARMAGSRIRCPWKVAPVLITDQNVEERALMLLDQYRKKSTLYRSDLVLAPLGDDFRYQTAVEWDRQYVNYQKLFDYINSRSDWNTEIKFATLSDYFTALEERTGPSPPPLSVHPPPPPLTPPHPVLTGDFFTYADRDDHYWSGYYTSRPFFKRLDRIMEAHLRGAELLFSMAAMEAGGGQQGALSTNALMAYLVTARRQLALFQHHDGITGTSKNLVVIDYGNRLIGSLRQLKTLMCVCADFLLRRRDDAKTVISEATTLLDVDEVRENHDSLPVKTVIKLADSLPRAVVFYNSLGHERQEVVRLYVSSPELSVTDVAGQPVLSQVDPYWTDAELISDSIYKLSFVVTVPAAGLCKYVIQQVAPSTRTLTYLSKVSILHSKSPQKEITGIFDVKKEIASGETLNIENSEMDLTISAHTGMLESVRLKRSGENVSAAMQFVRYETRKGKERSGAYLFLPAGEAQPFSYVEPRMCVIRGVIVSEVHVFLPNVHHTIRLHNSPGIDRMSIDIRNLVDIRSLTNSEVAMRLKTDVKEKIDEPIFYTDLNGFQTVRRRTWRKLPLQAQFYPAPTLAFVSAGRTRVTLLTGQSLGVGSLAPGWLEVMQDRRLNQDDSLGLGQPVIDNRITPNKFRIVIERTATTATQQAPTANVMPSLTVQLARQHFTHPIHVLPARSGATAATALRATYQGVRTPLACDLHLVNLRSLGVAPRGGGHRAALLLHRLVFDCAYPKPAVNCQLNKGEVRLSELFRGASLLEATATSLSLIHDSHNITSEGRVVRIPPMEIAAFRLSFK